MAKEEIQEEGKLTEKEQWENLNWRVSTAFTPAVPISEDDLFAGRRGELNKVIDAINQTGQHVAIYGERGVGKTSLANVIASRVISRTGAQAISPRVNCDVTDTFQGLWKKVFSNIQMVVEERVAGFTRETEERIKSALDMLPSDSEITPDNVRAILSNIGRNNLLMIILDEFDRLPQGNDRRAIADTIKSLSDNAVPATLIVVGVAETIGGLIADHQSIERALSQVPMPRMEPGELHEILERGTEKLGMSIDSAAKTKIAVLSQGFPSYTHRLGLHAARIAVEDRRLQIAVSDVNPAIREAVGNAQQSLQDSYRKAVTSPQTNNLYAQVLLACALAKNDQFGYFKAADVKEPMSRIMHKRYGIPSFSKHLNDFCAQDHGCVLKKEGVKRKYLYRFTSPLMQPFVVMKGILDGRVDEDESLSIFLSSSNGHSQPP